MCMSDLSVGLTGIECRWNIGPYSPQLSDTKILFKDVCQQLHHLISVLRVYIVVLWVSPRVLLKMSPARLDRARASNAMARSFSRTDRKTKVTANSSADFPASTESGPPS